jgi:hypothetical protein
MLAKTAKFSRLTASGIGPAGHTAPSSPTARATMAAVAGASPVTMTVRTPSAVNSEIREAESMRGGSLSAMKPSIRNRRRGGRRCCHARDHREASFGDALLSALRISRHGFRDFCARFEWNKAESDWLRGRVALDQQGFILTGRDLNPILAGTPRKWPLGRPPQMLEASLPAVYAVATSAPET